MDWISILKSEDVNKNESVRVVFQGFNFAVTRDPSCRLRVQEQNSPNVQWEIHENNHLVKIRRTSCVKREDQNEGQVSSHEEPHQISQVSKEEGTGRKVEFQVSDTQETRRKKDKSIKQAWRSHVDRIRNSRARDQGEENEDLLPPSSYENIATMEVDEVNRTILRAKASMRHELENAKQQREVLQGQISRISLQRQRLQNDREYLASKRDNLQVRIHDLELQVREALETLEPYEERVEVLERDVRNRQQASEILLREFQSERKKMNAIKGKAHELKSNMEMLKKQLHAAKEKVNSAENRLESLSENNQVRQYELDMMNGSIAVIERFLKADLIETTLDQTLPPSFQHLCQIMTEGRERLEELQLRRSSIEEQKAEDDSMNQEERNHQSDPYEDLQGNEQDELREWRSLPSVWIRRRRFAMNASSPRWKKRLQSEVDAWQDDSGRSPKVNRANQEALAQLKKKQLALEIRQHATPSANVAITTKFLEDHPWLSGQYRISCYEEMKDKCIQGWEREREERLKKQEAQEKPLREIWEAKGIPFNEEADVRRLRSIHAKSSYPSLEEDLDEFCRKMKGKWEELQDLFKMMDTSGDGLVDLNEFKNACAIFELHWSDSQMIRAFNHISRSSPHLDLSDLLDLLAPPRVTSETRNLLQTKVPFLQLESEEAMREVIRTMKPKHWSKGDRIYYLTQLESVIYVLYSGRVKLVEVDDTNSKMVGPGDVFGEEAVRSLLHYLFSHSLYRSSITTFTTTLFRGEATRMPWKTV
mmetsp:Transcript_24286/g.79224  ORF Transcript_24286/g.79224 Transcript_24286/m.79224 type:complete len:764 (-) Transcript_24286:1632-3923(-)